MSSPSISLSQPPSARLGALHNTSQDQDSNSLVSRLSPEENADSNRNSVLDAEAEHGRKPRRRRPRVPEYIPRRRNHGELREVVEGENCDLTDLWEPDSRERDHLPPPELVYESFDEAIAGVTEWAKEHGLAYRKQKWSHSRHYRLLMTCHRAGKRRERDSSSVSKPRLGAASLKTDCKMKFFLVAVDYTQLDGQWRVKWCKNRASITHNHPPVHDVYSIASYRRSTRTNELRAHLLAIWPLVRDATQAMLLLKESFPQAVFTRQDVVNELRHLQRPQAGTPSEIEELSAEMEEKDYWYRYKVDSENLITHLAFTSPQCLALFKSSPDVLMVDCTFKTNKQNVPLLTFVGSTGNHRTTHLATAMVKQKDEASFNWILTQLKDLFESNDIQIKVWVTADDDPDIINALDAVFSNPRIIMNTSQMEKDLKNYLQTQLSAQFGRWRDGRRLIENANTTEFMNLYTALMKSPTVAHYETYLAACERMSPEATAYLKRCWLNDHKEKLVSCWVDAQPHFGIKAPTKVEGVFSVFKNWLASGEADTLSLFRHLHPLHEEYLKHVQMSDMSDNSKVRNDCRYPIFEGVSCRITRYALGETAKILNFARAELEKQRLDESYSFTHCKGRYMRSRGMPCWHRLAELWRTSGVLQASDFHEHWWIEYGQAPQAPQAAQAAQPNIPPLEPQAIEIPQRQQRSPPRSDDRDPNLSERLDSAPSLSGGLNSNNRVATTAPQPTLDSLKIMPAVPQDRLFVYQATLPAVATPTTATTALSRPISAQNQQPPRASQTPLPAAALQQLPSHMLQRQQQQQQQFAHGQPPQHQLQAYPPPQSLRQVPLQSPRSPHQPQPPPSSSHRQAPALRWIVTTPNHAQPQQRPQRSRPPGAPISGAKNAR